MGEQVAMTWNGGTGGYDMGWVNRWDGEQVAMTWNGETGGYDMGWGNRWL